MPTALNTWLARHAQTLMGSLGRIVQHPVATAMTMAVIALALALPLFFNVLLENTRAATADWNQAFELSVYLAKKAGTERAEALAKQLRARPDVARVRVITAEQALVEFRESSGFGKALDLLDANPLPNALVVTPALAASTAEGTQALKTHIASLADVDTVQLDTEWVQRLNALLGRRAPSDLADRGAARALRRAGGGQHHSPRHPEPPGGNRGHEAGRRHR